MNRLRISVAMIVTTLACTILTPTLSAHAAACDPVVRQGDRGTCIKRVQQVLNDHLLREYAAPVTIDGVAGPQTVAGIKKFQRIVNTFYARDVLVVDGVLGSKSWKYFCYILGEASYAPGLPSNQVIFKHMRAAGCDNPGYGP